MPKSKTNAAALQQGSQDLLSMLGCDAGFGHAKEDIPLSGCLSIGAHCHCASQDNASVHSINS